MAKITYEYKTKLQDEPDIPNKNKVTDNDMNEIKDVVNTNADELDTAKENIENLEEGQGTNNTDITNLKGRVTTLEEDNVKNKGDISNLQKDNETNKTNISNLQNTKVDKTEGKGLSTEDFTTELKTKLEGLENYNDAEIQEKIQDIEGRVEILEDDNASNKSNITTLQGKVTNLEEDNTNNKSNITNLQKDVEDLGKGIEENTTDIQTLQAENKNLKEEIESYQNSLPRETLSGEYITMQNTADKVRFKDFVVGGNSIQASRSGKNILNINSPDLYEKDALAEIEGNKLSASCANVTSNSYISIPLELKPNTDYTFSGIAKVTENTTPEGTKNSYIKIRSEKTGGDWISTGVQATIDLKATGEQNIGLSFNSKEYTKGWLWIYLMDTTAEGNIGIDFTNLQVEEGTGATAYEEYGASPSPEFISEIENAGNNINLINKDEPLHYSTYGSKLNNTVLTSNSNYTGYLFKCKPNTDYTISRGDTNSDRFRAFCFDENPTENLEAVSTNGVWGDATGASYDRKVVTFKTTENSKYIYVVAGYNGELSENVKAEEGTIATPYSAYNCGNVDVKLLNKNVAISNWAERFVNIVNNSEQAKLENIDGRRCLFWTANAGYKNDSAYFFKYMFKENTRYVITFDMKPSTQQGNFVINYADGTSGNRQNLTANTWQKITIISKANTTIKEIRPGYYSGQCYIDLDSVQITEGIEEQDYTPNEQQTVTFPLAENQKLYLGDYLADDGIHHIRKQIELDGTENWLRQSTQHVNIINLYLVLEKQAKNRNIIYCSIAKQSTAVGQNNDTNANVCNLNSSLTNFLIDLSLEKFDSIETWKAYLAEQKQAGTPIIIEYTLLEEEIEPYTEEQQEAYNKLKQLTSYSGQTNIYSTNSPSPIFTVTGIKDVNSLITQVNSMLLERS